MNIKQKGIMAAIIKQTETHVAFSTRSGKEYSIHFNKDLKKITISRKSYGETSVMVEHRILRNGFTFIQAVPSLISKYDK